MDAVAVVVVVAVAVVVAEVLVVVIVGDDRIGCGSESCVVEAGIRVIRLIRHDMT